eukprot:PITA_31999
MINTITHIQNSQGERVEDHAAIEQELLTYFKQVHHETQTDRTEAIDKIIKSIPKIITEEHNQMLLKLITLQEVEKAVQQLKEGKAPGPNGFTSNFFHNFWDLIKLEVWQVVEESRANRWMLPSMNATFITLIPKEAHSRTPDKFRPIALCNIIYKIVSKVIASRLKPLLPLLISPEQSGYVEGRQITDGIILTHEIIHSLKQHKKAVGLGRCIKDALHSQQLRGLSFPNSPPFTHQQFVDDNMLYGHPFVQEARKLKSLLNNFLAASGASINQAKSQIFFFHTPAATQASIARILGFQIAALPSNYPGAPLTDVALKHSSWNLLLEKLEARLSSWTHKSLNMPSRLVLIKSILQSMSLYLFSILAAPKWVLKEIKKLQRSFLWGNSEQKRKWALVKWEKVCLPKHFGGTGLRDPHHSNAVMGARIWWNWLTAPNTPWATLWTAKYANNRPVEDLIRLTDIDSWQQQHRLLDLINPHQIPNWEAYRFDKINQYWKPTLTHGFRQWVNPDHIIRNGLEPNQQILGKELSNRKIRYSEKKDVLRWGYEAKGMFTTHEAYNIIIKESALKDPLWTAIWAPNLWPKVSTFLSLLCQNKILT